MKKRKITLSIIIITFLLSLNLVLAKDIDNTEIENLIQDGKYNKVTKILNEKINKTGNDFYLLGRIQLIQNQQNEAINSFQKALELNFNSSSIYNGLALAYTQNNDTTNALIFLDKAIEIDPDNYLGYCIKGALLNNVELINKSIAIKPSAFAYSERARINYIKNEKYSEALNDLDKALELDNKYANAYYYRALLHSEALYPRKAIKDYNKLIKLIPDNWVYYFNRGVQRYNVGGDFLWGAVKDFNRASKLNPDCKEARMNYLIAKERRDNMLLSAAYGGLIASISISNQMQTNSQLQNINMNLQNLNNQLFMMRVFK